MVRTKRRFALTAGIALAIGIATTSVATAGAVSGAAKAVPKVRPGLVIRIYAGMTVGQYINDDGSVAYGFASSAPATATRVRRTIVVGGKKVTVSGLAVTPAPFGASDAAATAASIAANGICDKKLLLAAGVPAAMATMINDQAGQQDSCTPKSRRGWSGSDRPGDPAGVAQAGVDLLYDLHVQVQPRRL